MDTKKKKSKKELPPTNCEMCVYFDTDPDTGEEYCSVNLDEDEMERFLRGATARCPFYRRGDDYTTARKQ